VGIPQLLSSVLRPDRGGLQDLQRGVTGLIEGIIHTNLRATQELLRLANPGVYVELQHRVRASVSRRAHREQRYLGSRRSPDG
jgi:hypothetical protein